LIPEAVPIVTSVASRRPGRWDTPLGSFEYRYIKSGFFSGYRLTELGGGQQAFLAAPEKALLDLVHLHPGGDTVLYLQELRLQNLNLLSIVELRRIADLSASPKLRRAALRIADLSRAESDTHEVV
jgi:hypothetical protein